MGTCLEWLPAIIDRGVLQGSRPSLLDITHLGRTSSGTSKSTVGGPTGQSESMDLNLVLARFLALVETRLSIAHVPRDGLRSHVIPPVPCELDAFFELVGEVAEVDSFGHGG